MKQYGFTPQQFYKEARMLKENLPGLLLKLVALVHTLGGKAMLVGGSVVDMIQGRDPKDWDIEVYGVSYDKLVEALSDYGVKTCGKAFGIIKLSRALCDGLDVDISIPRRDNNIGVGHKDFESVLDPTMTPKEGAMRRDFTMNSLFYCFEEETVLDYFGGLEDLEKGLLRATDPRTFVEDPLRAFRAMQLVARKARGIEYNTMNLIKGMVSNQEAFDSLSRERIHEEWRKLLLKAERPSVGLEFLEESGLIRYFPELEATVGCGQHPDWHKEGDVWTHTKCIADSAAWARDKVDEEWQEAFVFGAMLHDIGKPTTTVFPHLVESGEFPKERLWTAYGHDRAGVDPAKAFMGRLTNDKKLTERVSVIVGEHMQSYQLHQGGAKPSAWKKLHNKLRLDIAGWVSRCDSCGNFHSTIGDPDLDHNVSVMAWDYYEDFGGPEPIKQILMGRHLKEAGFTPGPDFGRMLGVAYEAQIEDETLTEEDLLKVAVNFMEAGNA